MRWWLLSIPILALFTACPDTWGRGGIVDTAVEQDTRNSMRKRRPPPGCPMSLDEWAEVCDADVDQKLADCPKECRSKY